MASRKAIQKIERRIPAPRKISTSTQTKINGRSAKPVPVDANLPDTRQTISVSSIADIRRRVKPREITIESLSTDAERVTMYHLPISSRVAEAFQSLASLPEGEIIPTARKHLAEVLCKEDGSPLATEEELRELPVGMLLDIMAAVAMGARGQSGAGGKGNG